MSDFDAHEGDTGDADDTFEDRIVVIVRLIDTTDEETEERRKLLRRALILRLLIQLQQETNAKIQALLDRAGDF